MTVVPGWLVHASILIVALSIVLIVLARLWGLKCFNHDQEQQRLRQVEQHVYLFSRLIEQSLSSRLRAPTHPDLDQLLRKLSEDTISTAEAHILHRLILERVTELQVQGLDQPELEFPRLLTLWSVEVRLARAGQTVEMPAGGHHRDDL